MHHASILSPKKPVYTSTPSPPGPQLQALWRDEESVKRMYYRREKTYEIIIELQKNHGSLSQFTDFLHGSEYLQEVWMGRLQDNDMVLMLSIDGAQLFEYKASDVWIYKVSMLWPTLHQK